MKLRHKVASAVILLALGATGSALAGGSHGVKGYVKSNGTYVAPHRATNPDGRSSNNWTTKGNVNPYTGTDGTKPDSSSLYSPPKPPKPYSPN